MVSVVDGSMIAVWVFTESACSWADSWGTGGAAQKWWMLCLPWLSACSVGRGGEGEGRGREREGEGEWEWEWENREDTKGLPYCTPC